MTDKISRRGLVLRAGAAAAMALLMPVVPSIARQVDKLADDLLNGEYNWFPERSEAGPVILIVSIPDQKVHVYRNGIRIAASTCSTGKPGHRTPTGVFKILQKDKHHRSSTYNNAPMPNMNRLTWSGIALHAGNLPGYPASHGCIRLPMEFSEKLFAITKLGMTVVIADETSSPASVVHPGLVLGEYARTEYAAIDRSIKANAYAEGRVGSPKDTSIVVSGHDRVATLLDSGRIVAQGQVEIDDASRPLRDRLYTLARNQSDKGLLGWLATDHGNAATAPRPDDTDLRRIKVEPKIRAKIRQSLHMGATLVTSSRTDRQLQQLDPDFVVIHGLY
jgi:hypothetical protein